MSRPYEVLEHTADVGIRAWGRTLEEVFANMALGMMSLIIPESGLILEKEERRVEARAADLESLLVAWLSEFVYLVDAERFLVAKIEDVRISKREPGRAAVQGTAQTAAFEFCQTGERAAGRPDGESTRGAGTQDAVAGDLGPAVWAVTALARGESIDPVRHPLELEIKGVSYHLVKVERVGGKPGTAGAAGKTAEMAGDEIIQGDGWVAQAIFDV